MDRAGAEVMIMNLYRAVDRDAVQFDFLVHERRKCAFDDEIQDLGGRLYRLPRFNGVNYFSYQKACRQFFSADAGNHPVVHGHIGAPAAIYLSEAKRAGSITIAHSHGENGPLSLPELGFRIFSYPTRYIADYCFACSPEAGVDRFGKRVMASDRGRIIPNGIDTQRFAFSQEKRIATREALGLVDAHIVGHVGRFDPAKNHEFLIPVFAGIARRDPHAHLVLVGSGPLKESVQKAIAAHDIADRVVILENRSDIPDLLSAFDCFLFPSIHEGVPVALLEAQASGLPCFVSDAIRDSAFSPQIATQLTLASGADAWAERVASSLAEPHDRTAGPGLVRSMGYDINESARQLQDFYLSVTQRPDERPSA